ncbi:hypothetical protein [Siccirubricoccus phaeus]|uniref:hypothetical protein n=1 Tax=Siccirubricoccus phaeus TaxID=2595053 RepID=UPI0011F352FD|nr:hypothetical protein [Siccirubricoccus phaeus]
MTYLDADLLALAATLLLLGGVPALAAWWRSLRQRPGEGAWGVSAGPAPVFREAPQGVLGWNGAGIGLRVEYQAK